MTHMEKYHYNKGNRMKKLLIPLLFLAVTVFNCVANCPEYEAGVEEVTSDYDTEESED